MDIVYIGPSNAYLHFNTVLAYKSFGFTTGLISADSQPVATIKYLIKESQKYQNPLLYVIDLSMLPIDTDIYNDSEIRKTLDSIPFSYNRINAYNELLKYETNTKKDYIGHYFSFFMYHNKWKKLWINSFSKIKNFYKGYFLDSETVKINPQNKYKWNNNIVELPKENEQILINLLTYIKENNLNVLFIIPNKYFQAKYISRLNYTTSIIKKSGYKVINFNAIDGLDIDYESNFYNRGHLNVYGSTKFTLYFSKYLKENYDLPDHRKDKKYNSWDKEYKRFKEDFNKLTQKNFNELINK